MLEFLAAIGIIAIIFLIIAISFQIYDFFKDWWKTAKIDNIKLEAEVDYYQTLYEGCRKRLDEAWDRERNQRAAILGYEGEINRMEEILKEQGVEYVEKKADAVTITTEFGESKEGTQEG